MWTIAPMNFAPFEADALFRFPRPRYLAMPLCWAD
jgi:hypothetical protein